MGFATEYQNNQHACCCCPQGEEGCGHHRPQGQDRLQPCRHPQARCRQQQGRRCQGRHPGQACPQDGLCQGQERRQLQARQGCEAQEGQEGCEEEGRQEASCQEGGTQEEACCQEGSQEEGRTQEEVNDPAIICTLCT